MKHSIVDYLIDMLNKDRRFLPLSKINGYYPNMADDEYLRRRWKAVMGVELDLDNPTTFNEKLQWLKLYDRNPIYTTMVDKFDAKQYIADIVGSEHIIPTIGIWEDPEKIDFSSLPNQFVLKCTHNSGLGMCICRDKSALNIRRVKSRLKAGLKQNYYLLGREYPYKEVKPRIIAEQYLQDDRGVDLTDYKFFCFNGTAKFMYISNDNASHPTTDFFDMNFNLLKMRMKDNNSDNPPSRPECFDEMRRMAERLSLNVPFLRVDFYYVNKVIYVGELTFFHNSGFTRIHPTKWEKLLGDWIVLPDNT